MPFRTIISKPFIMHYYFAYGSNMDLAQMRERCPSAVLVGKAVLKGYVLAFTIYSPARRCSCADIVRNADAETWGLLYRLSDEALARMDKFESHPTQYRRITVRAISAELGETVCETYEVVRKSPGLASSEAYLRLLRNAARKFDFPASYQEMLARVQT